MIPFIGFGFVVFPLHWMSPCSSLAATRRAEHLLLTTGCFTDIRDTHAGLFLILPGFFTHPGVSAIPWTSLHPSPFPESLFLLSLMLCVWFLLCRASSRQGRSPWWTLNSEHAEVLHLTEIRLFTCLKISICLSTLLNSGLNTHIKFISSDPRQVLPQRGLSLSIDYKGSLDD